MNEDPKKSFGNNHRAQQQGGGARPRLQPTPQQLQFNKMQNQDPYGSSYGYGQPNHNSGYPLQNSGFQNNNQYSRPPPLQQHQQQYRPHHQPYAPQSQPYGNSYQANRTAPRPSQHKMFNQVHGSRQNLIHSGTGLAGNLRSSLPHPPVVSEHTIVYMVQFKMEFRYYVASPFMDEIVRMNDFVLVEAEKGEDLGLVVDLLSLETYVDRRKKEERSGQFEEDERVLRHILKVAHPDDLMLLPEKFHDENNVIAHSNEVVKRVLVLPMRIVDAEYQFDRAKITFYYTANLRVDFRELISKLFSIFQTRVWLKKLNTNLVFEPPMYAVSALRTGVLIAPRIVSPSSSTTSSVTSVNSLSKTSHLGAIGPKVPTSPPASTVSFSSVTVPVFVPGGCVPRAVDFSEEEVMAQYMSDSDEEEEDNEVVSEEEVQRSGDVVAAAITQF
eukprot:gene28936-35890_t